MNNLRLCLAAAFVILGAVLASDSSRAATTGEAAASVPAAPEDGGPRNWEVTGLSGSLNLREEPATTARVVAGYAPGTILDNLGCRLAAGRVWCDVQKFGGGPRGFVAAEFLKPAVSPDGSVATGDERYEIPDAVVLGG